MKCNKEQYIWNLLRIGLGWIMLWAFLDKLFGLGFKTASDKSWLSGTSPSFGFLKFGTHGPFAEFFQSLAGNVIVDWLFMLGLLFVGLAFILGVFTRIAGYTGALIMFLIYLTLIPPENNPILDEHIIYLIIFLGIAIIKPGSHFCIGKWWSNASFVKRYKLLE